MKFKNLLVITNNYPNEDNSYVGDIFVKEQINYLKKHFETVNVISPVAYGIERLRKTTYKNYRYDNVNVYFPKYLNIPFFYNKFRPLWNRLETNAILRFLKSKRISFDIIHAHFTWPSGAVAVELKKHFKVPVVITEHTSTTFKRAIDEKDETFINTWESCDAIIRVRSTDISSFEDVGISKSKIFHVPNGFDSSKFFQDSTSNCRKKLNLPLDKKIILNVGNLYGEVKGHRYLIEAIYEIVKHRNDVLCIIVGKGKLENSIQEQIYNLKLENFVKLVGGKSYDEVSLWMNACNVFVMPSLRESFGVVQVEALACGKPVVATFNGGSESIIVSDEYGLLAEPGDSQGLADKIELALEKEWDEEKIKKYVEQYQWEYITGKTLKIYNYI